MWDFLRHLFHTPHIKKQRDVITLPKSLNEQILDREYEEILRGVKELEIQASVRLGRDYGGRWET